jgi:hypothetical protein
MESRRKKQYVEIMFGIEWFDLSLAYGSFEAGPMCHYPLVLKLSVKTCYGPFTLLAFSGKFFRC